MGVALDAFALFALHRREPALHHGVVVAVPATAHGAHDAVLLESGAIVLAGIRAPLVGVMQQAWLWTASLHGHVQGPQREMPIVDGTQSPAHDEPRVEVEDGR